MAMSVRSIRAATPAARLTFRTGRALAVVSVVVVLVVVVVAAALVVLAAAMPPRTT